jgi:hypothetical protein
MLKINRKGRANASHHDSQPGFDLVMKRPQFLFTATDILLSNPGAGGPACRSRTINGANNLMIRPLILSGGQTGVDRAALDVAISRTIPYSGWCPLGGRAEDFPDPPGLLDRYDLRPTPSVASEQRTAWNVRDSHATLIIVSGPSLEASKGTLFAKLCAELIFLRPCRVIDLGAPNKFLDSASQWLTNLLDTHGVDQLAVNFAGPRESESPGIYERAFEFIDRLLD